MINKNPYILVYIVSLIINYIMYVNDKLNKKESNLVKILK